MLSVTLMPRKGISAESRRQANTSPEFNSNFQALSIDNLTNLVTYSLIPWFGSTCPLLSEQTFLSLPAGVFVQDQSRKDAGAWTADSCFLPALKSCDF